MATGDKSTHRLRALNKKTGEKTMDIGVGWQNADGTITLVFNRFVQLPTEREWLYTLFPNDRDEKKK